MGRTKGSQKTETAKQTTKPKKEKATPAVEFTETESESEDETSYAQLEKSMKKLFQDFKKEMKKDMRDLEESLNYNNGKLDDMIQSMSMFQSTLNKMAEKQEILEKENKDLKIRVEELEISMDDLQQYTRNKNIQIDGIIKVKDENLKDIVIAIGEKVNLTIQNNDIDAIHRVPTRSKINPEPIIVQFLSRQMKESIVQKVKSTTITTKDLNINGIEKQIYVNDHLTTKKKELMYEARQLKKAKNYKFLWSKNGKIFIRKNETSTVISLNNLDDLKKIV